MRSDIYRVVLAPGNRINNAPVSSSEFAHMERCMQYLQNRFKSNCLAVYPAIGVLVVKLTPAEVDELRAESTVLLIQPQQQYAQHTVQADAGWALAFLGNNTNAYEYTTTGLGVTVYVLDSGIDLNSTELQGRITRLVHLGESTSVHGTQVAELMAGTTYGVAKQATVIDVQASTTDTFTDLDVFNGITAILDDMLTKTAPCVVNISFGSSADDVLDSAVQSLINAGAIVVVSAGNEAVDASTVSPARLAAAITVGALDKDGSQATFSNYGTAVDTWAPGVEVLTSKQVFTGTSAAAPLVAGAIARTLELAPHMTTAQFHSLLTPQCRAVIPALVTKLPKRACRVRTWWMDGATKVYGPWTFIQQFTELGIIRSAPSVQEQSVALAVPATTLVPGSNPTIPATDNLVPLTLDPDEVYAYSVQLSYPSGTFSFAGFFTPTPAVNDILNIQGLNGAVRRVGPSLSRSTPGTQVEGRLLPLFATELVSIRKSTGKYLVSELVAEVASKAGTVVNFAGTDNVIKEFEFSGRFTEVLGRLATEACAVLLQQNGSWYILPVDQALGQYTAPAEACISCRQTTQVDVLDELIGLLNDYNAASRALGVAQRRVEELEEVTDAVVQAGSVNAKQPFTNISFEFGVKNKDRRALESSVLVEDGLWDTWTGSAAGPLSSYYQTITTDVGIKGCKNLNQAKLLVRVNAPSDASGAYFAKGRLVNLTTPFWAGDETTWGYITPVYRTVDDQQTMAMFFEFAIQPISWNQPNPSWLGDAINTCVDDERQYICDLELAYLPAQGSNVTFNGTIAKGDQLILRDGKLVGSLPRTGGTVVSSSGQTLWEYDQSAATFLSQTGVLQATLVGGVITSVNGSDYGYLGPADYYPIRGDSGQLIGAISETGDVINTLNISLGTYVEPRWTATTSVVKTIRGTIGSVYGGDTTAPKIVLAETVRGIGADDLYAQVEDDLLALEYADAIVDRDVAAAKLACLEKALIRLKCPLAPVRSVAKLWEEYYIELEKDAPDTSLLNSKEDAAQTAADALLVQISALATGVLVTELEQLYQGTLPLPGNALILALDGVEANAGVIESVSVSFTNSSSTMTVTSKLWT